MKLWSNNNIQSGAGGFNPERRLLAAVLQRAITDYLTGDGELQENAQNWLYNNDEIPDTFGFSFICEALDFHQDELRRAIKSQYEGNIAATAAAAAGSATKEQVFEYSSAQVG